MKQFKGTSCVRNSLIKKTVKWNWYKIHTECSVGRNCPFNGYRDISLSVFIHRTTSGSVGCNIWYISAKIFFQENKFFEVSFLLLFFPILMVGSLLFLRTKSCGKSTYWLRRVKCTIHSRLCWCWKSSSDMFYVACYWSLWFCSTNWIHSKKYGPLKNL